MLLLLPRHSLKSVSLGPLCQARVPPSFPHHLLVYSTLETHCNSNFPSLLSKTTRFLRSGAMGCCPQHLYSLVLRSCERSTLSLLNKKDKLSCWRKTNCPVSIGWRTGRKFELISFICSASFSEQTFGSYFFPWDVFPGLTHLWTKITEWGSRDSPVTWVWGCGQFMVCKRIFPKNLTGFEPVDVCYT
jgi:hypothetical protein